MWLMTWQEEDAIPQSEAVLLGNTINIIAYRLVTEELLSHPQYKRLMKLTNQVCHQLRQFHDNKVCKKLRKEREVLKVQHMRWGDMKFSKFNICFLYVIRYKMMARRIQKVAITQLLK